MIKTLVLLTLTFIILLALITTVNPAVGFQLAIYIGLIVAQPISIALKLGLLLRGLM